MRISSDAPIAVVGAGTMGIGIAQVAASAGHPVLVIDTSEGALGRGRTGLEGALDKAVEKGIVESAEGGRILDRVRWSTDLASAAPAALVIEAIVEKLAPKRELFFALDRIVPAETLLASNTSSLGISEIAGASRRPNRVLGLHFFNPVPAMKLVEVIAGRESDPKAIDAAAALMKAWGKQPARVSDVPGFIVNRVARPYYAEGFAALGEGIAPATIDSALTEAGGFRMGPLALADLIGHDVNYAVASSVYEAGFGTHRFRPQGAQLALVQERRLGRKSGCGVYDYSQPLPEACYREQSRKPSGIRVSDPGLLRPLVEAAELAGVGVVFDENAQSDAIDVDGTRVALGDGRPLSQRPDVDVLVDHARDFGTARTVVLSARSLTHVGIACGFLGIAGRRALVVADRPGQLVLRTLAQLANAAADAVNDRIATADDVAVAMRYGANHPEGPLAWAERVGRARVRIALQHLAYATGDALYEPSSHFNGD